MNKIDKLARGFAHFDGTINEYIHAKGMNKEIAEQVKTALKR